MAKADLIGWDWKIEGGELVVFPTATYRFSRKANGDLVVRIPHLFSTSEHRIPVTSIRDCAIGNYTKLVGKYGSQVQLWYVSLVPTDATQFQLPLFVITDQLPKDSTGKPPNLPFACTHGRPKKKVAAVSF